MNILRRLLDFIYFASGALAAVSLVAILLLIVVQMIARWTGEVFPGAASYAGYAMAAASFLAFANALNRGAHIRVSVLLNALPAGPKRLLEISPTMPIGSSTGHGSSTKSVRHKTPRPCGYRSR